MRPESNPAVESLRKEQKAQRKAEREGTEDERLNKALKATFPASDPVAAESPAKPGAPKKRRQ
ncbi:hypothetical protein FG93_03446 [Bosea sp. LC85]|uniref:hypothetical protein n=1 Tax=Bosea sp. LC85 TaxID=1502851 RepID=UPI0004E3E7F6|nr:hypothetical protein [Bosea sp. LC85]KFC69400.1 hypothetical protein FG93_03446 [Bosea sp. LC85]